MSIRRLRSSRLNGTTDPEREGPEDVAKEDMRPYTVPGNSMATSSSLNSIHISPRTPKTPKAPRMGMDYEEEGVELSLLGEEERLQASLGLEDMADVKRPIGAKDKRGMVLLCVLCEYAVKYMVRKPKLTGPPIDLIQGVPVRLSTHSSVMIN